MKIKETLLGFGVLAAILTVIGAQLWIVSYKYDDCRKVGHQRAYCVMQALGI